MELANMALFILERKHKEVDGFKASRTRILNPLFMLQSNYIPKNIKSAKKGCPSVSKTDFLDNLFNEHNDLLLPNVSVANFDFLLISVTANTNIIGHSKCPILFTV